MEWWKAAGAGITPIAVFDSDSVYSDEAIAERMGSVRKLLFTKKSFCVAPSSQKEANKKAIKAFKKISTAMVNNLAYDSAIPAPPEGFMISFIKPLGNITLNQEAGKPATAILSFNSASGKWKNMATPESTYVGDDWQIVAAVWSASMQRIFINNDWATAELPLASVNRAASFSGVPSGQALFDFSAYAIFSGLPSLDDLRALSAALKETFSLAAIGAVCSASQDKKAQFNLPQPLTLKRANQHFVRLNHWQRGNSTIKGIVTIEKVPASRKVRLYERSNGRLVDETWSKDDGSYAFYNLDEAKEYFAVAHDHTRVYNAVIQDMLVTNANF